MTMPHVTFRLFLCLLLALGAAAARAADDSKPNRLEKQKSSTTKRAAKTHEITIKSSRFSPASLTIKAGDTVIWTNEDDKDHTVNADDKSFKSDNLSLDESYEFVFKKTGTFKYGCRYHPREKGTITVEK